MEALHLFGISKQSHMDPTSDQHVYVVVVMVMDKYQIEEVARVVTRNDLSSVIAIRTVHIHNQAWATILVFVVDGAHATSGPEITLATYESLFKPTCLSG